MKKNAIDYINKENVINLLTTLVNIPSPYFHEEKIMDTVHLWLNNRGLDPKFHYYSEKKVTNFHGVNVIGTLKGKEPGPKIYLNGHIDTVNQCEGWVTPPFTAEIHNNKLYGIGALDMKSGVSAIMLALEAFKNLNGDFNGEIIYSIVSDEEGPYGLGTDAVIKDGLVDNIDVAIVTEPSSGFCKKPFPCVCLGARGGFNYTVTLKGKSSHAANPEKGINAAVDCAKVIIELEKSTLIEDENLGKGSICILNINSKSEACSVPDTASFTVFRHVVRGEDSDYIKNELFQAVKKANISSSIEFSFREYPSEDTKGFLPYTVDKNNEYVDKFIKTVEKVSNKQCTVDYFKSIGDFNYIGSRLNVPTVIFGPNGDNYHTCNEYVEIDTVVETSMCIYNYLCDLLCS